MSHYIVVVVGKNVDEQLKPYDENTEVEPYPSSLGENAVKEARDYYTKHPENLKERGVNSYTDEELLKEYHEEEVKLIDGVWHRMTTYNPKSKWDWYTVGGRWAGYWYSTKGFKKDIIEKREIDFAKIRATAEEAARERYNKHLEIVKDVPPLQYSWKALIERVDAKQITIQEARTLYHAQPRIEATRSRAWWDVYGMDGVDKFDAVTIDEFARKAAHHAVTPYAYVKDGEWYAKGEMGWFGISDDKEGDEEWGQHFMRMLSELPDDEILTAVDCHI